MSVPIHSSTSNRSFVKSIPALAVSGLALGTTYALSKRTGNQLALLKTDILNTSKKAEENSKKNKKLQKILHAGNAAGWLTALGGTIWTAFRAHETDSIMSEILRSAILDDPSYDETTTSKRMAKKILSVVQDETRRAELLQEFKDNGVLP